MIIYDRVIEANKTTITTMNKFVKSFVYRDQTAGIWEHNSVNIFPSYKSFGFYVWNLDGTCTCNHGGFSTMEEAKINAYLSMLIGERYMDHLYRADNPKHQIALSP